MRGPKISRCALSALALGSSFLLGAAFPRIYENHFSGAQITLDRMDRGKWPNKFSVIEYEGADGATQKAYFFQGDVGAPLVVSLHTWSGGYDQFDPIAKEALDRGWGYLRPDVRGPNNSPEACLSEFVIPDLDAAVALAQSIGLFKQTILVGASGGGYVALGAFLKSKTEFDYIYAWVPISDLGAWYEESRSRGDRYAEDILACTESGESLNIEEAARRSPLHWDVDIHPDRSMSIFAGIEDGYRGTVPISHSLRFFDKIALETGSVGVPGDEALAAMSRGLRPTGEKISGRNVFMKKKAGPVELIIFDGAHEMVVDYQIERLGG